MSLLLNMLSRLVIAFLPRSKGLNFMTAVTIFSDFGAHEKCISCIIGGFFTHWESPGKPKITSDFNPWVGKIPWRRIWQPTPVGLPGESPWIVETGRLQSMELQRVWHNWATKHSTAQGKKWRSYHHYAYLKRESNKVLEREGNNNKKMILGYQEKYNLVNIMKNGIGMPLTLEFLKLCLMVETKDIMLSDVIFIYRERIFKTIRL